MVGWPVAREEEERQQPQPEADLDKWTRDRRPPRPSRSGEQRANEAAGPHAQAAEASR